MNTQKTQTQKVLLLDLDGTLIDSKMTIANHFIKALKECNIPHNIDEYDIGENLETPFEEINTMFNIKMNDEEFNIFLNKYRNNYHAEPINGTKVFEGVFEVLEYLKQENHLLVLATGKHIENAVKILQQLKLDPYFDYIQGWEEDLQPKPEPDILIRAIKKIGADKTKCIMVGDTHVDILAGKNINIPTVAALYGLGKSSTLKKYEPDFFINSIKELPQIIKTLS